MAPESSDPDGCLAIELLALQGYMLGGEGSNCIVQEDNLHKCIPLRIYGDGAESTRCSIQVRL